MEISIVLYRARYSHFHRLDIASLMCEMQLTGICVGINDARSDKRFELTRIDIIVIFMDKVMEKINPRLRESICRRTELGKLCLLRMRRCSRRGWISTCFSPLPRVIQPTFAFRVFLATCRICHRERLHFAFENERFYERLILTRMQNVSENVDDNA